VQLTVSTNPVLDVEIRFLFWIIRKHGKCENKNRLSTPRFAVQLGTRFIKNRIGNSIGR